MTAPLPTRLPLHLDAVDAFELPDWLGTDPVTWVADEGLRGSWRVAGRLCGTAGELAADLVAVDLAYPEPVVGDDVRVRTHQAWQHGQILILGETGPGGERLVLAVPASAFTADLAIDALARVAAAVGASLTRYAVQLQIGRELGPFGG